MADARTLSPDLSRIVLAVARTLVTAARSWALYRPENPPAQQNAPDPLGEIGVVTPPKYM